MLIICRHFMRHNFSRRGYRKDKYYVVFRGKVWCPVEILKLNVDDVYRKEKKELNICAINLKKKKKNTYLFVEKYIWKMWSNIYKVFEWNTCSTQTMINFHFYSKCNFEISFIILQFCRFSHIFIFLPRRSLILVSIIYLHDWTSLFYLGLRIGI